jgi:hypothetical protein
MTSLTLREVANWQHSGNPGESIKARVPALQRGAVWDTGQMELLWDSILRGFPIGSFVICNKLGSQKGRQGMCGKSNADDEDYSHHLLDGQQRANAIALGFSDPFSKDPPPAALWLDLSPSPAENNSRRFLFRVTTEAHPWGYAKADKTQTISAQKMRDALKAYGWRDGDDKPIRDGRPKPHETWLIEAIVPIPFAWLIPETEKQLDDPKAFWKTVAGRCHGHFNQNPDATWAGKVFSILDKTDAGITQTQTLELIVVGLRRVVNFQLVLLEVPQDALIDASDQEIKDSTGAKENIANVEHLFQRLNAGGTPLGGEELAYSMIKAYWPEVEQPIEKLAEQRMPASRLAMLGARVSSTPAVGAAIPPGITCKPPSPADAKDWISCRYRCRGGERVPLRVGCRDTGRKHGLVGGKPW